MPDNSVSLMHPVVESRIPGDLAMWCFILAELAVFGVFFLVCGWHRWHYPSVFSNG